MFFKKRKDSFVAYAKKIRWMLDKGNHDMALARYDRLKDYYDLMDSEKQSMYESEFNSLMNQLILYLKLEELDLLVKGDDIDLMRDGLNEVEYLLNETSGISPSYFGFVNSKRKKLLKEFNCKLVMSELDSLLKKVHKLKDEQNFDQALHMFPKVMDKYKELREYSSDTSELYKQLMTLRDFLKMQLLEFEAHSKVAKVNVRTLKKSLKKKDPEGARALYKDIFG